MNKNARKWVEALRSDEYLQGTGLLAVQEGGSTFYCCLGVACELFRKENELDISPKSELHKGRMALLYESEKYHLPPQVQEWLGLSHADGGYLEEDDSTTTLANENDHGATFEEIATIIESEPRGLFT